ncbi:MAG: hypothetical protein HYT97_07685 [Elusimicrobia bacterium]|nr:hypothetical protein [Elusimicrobiota bacterium]
MAQRIPYGFADSFDRNLRNLLARTRFNFSAPFYIAIHIDLGLLTKTKKVAFERLNIQKCELVRPSKNHIDRLIHHSDIIKIEGVSYRIKERKTKSLAEDLEK